MNIKIKTLIASLVVLTGISQPVYAAKPWSATVKCPVQVFDDKLAPKNLPKFYFGYAKHNNKPIACNMAEKQARSQFPRGTKPKHCRCMANK